MARCDFILSKARAAGAGRPAARWRPRAGGRWAELVRQAARAARPVVAGVAPPRQARARVRRRPGDGGVAAVAQADSRQVAGPEIGAAAGGGAAVRATGAARVAAPACAVDGASASVARARRP